jgi:replicative superfamily II helicase
MADAIDTIDTETETTKVVDGSLDKTIPEESPVIDESKKENHDFRRMKKFIERAARAEERVAILEQQAAQKEQAVQPTNEKPIRENFQSDEDFIDALTEFKVNKKIPDLINSFRENELTNANNQQTIALREKYSDFDDIMAEANEIAVPARAMEPLTVALRSSGIAEEIKYYLASNPDEYNRICSLTPLKIISAIDAITDKLSGKAQVASVKKPAPIVPPKSKGTGGQKPQHELDAKELLEDLKKEQSARYKR